MVKSFTKVLLLTSLVCTGLPAAYAAPSWWQATAGSAPVEEIVGKELGTSWAITGAGKAASAVDPGLGKSVLTAENAILSLDGKVPATGPREVRLLVRLRTDVMPNVMADLYLAKKDAKDSGLRVLTMATRTNETITCQVFHANKPLHDTKALAEKLDWAPQVANSLSYNLRAYNEMMPGWPEEFRKLVEKDMASLPNHNDKWLDLRVELGAGSVRVWLDDRIVAHKRDATITPDGLSRLVLSPGVQVAAFQSRPLPNVPRGYLPVRLGGYANALNFLGNARVQPEAIAPASNVVQVGGIPFVFSGQNLEGNDHIDVGRSLFRQANGTGYQPTNSPSSPRFIGSRWRDPARIQLRVPNGQYDSLYVIAAADGDKDSLPLVTASFYRPDAGFAENFESRIPLATANSSGGARPLQVTLSNGRKTTLWLVKIPLSPEQLTSLSDMDTVEFELTKQVHQYRSYPDPISYGWHAGGLPSGVHIYAATLGEVPVGFTFNPDAFGHVWNAPGPGDGQTGKPAGSIPSYTSTLTNHTQAPQRGTLTVTTRSYDGTETGRQQKSILLASGAVQHVKLSFPVKLFGYHDIEATLNMAGRQWREKRSFVLLAPDTRSTKWTEGKGALFGYWSYHGGHHTPNANHVVNLMTRAGARASLAFPAAAKDNELLKKHWSRVQAGAWEVSPQGWAAEEPVDMAKYQAYKKEVIEKFTKARENVPEEFRPDHVYFFPEPHVSQRLTAGNYPEYWNGTPFEYTEEEKTRLRMFMVTARAAAEAVRETWPNLKILIPWGDPLFAVPLLRAGFPKNLIDGSGLDVPGFERLPEMQLHQISPHRVYILKKEFEKAGIPDPQLQYNEGIFVPTEVGAVSWREQMDIYNRWSLLAMAHGIDRFYSGWFAFDATNYYGAEHYGGCGIQRKIPYADPKPAYAAYATMTDKLNEANFDGWVQTGSPSTYCLRFKGPKGYVYTLWTLRGKRPVTLTVRGTGSVQVTDAMNNTRSLGYANTRGPGTVTVTTDPSVTYVTGTEITGVQLGVPNNGDATQTPGATSIADLADGTWKYTNERDKTYETNAFAMERFPGRFGATIAQDPQRGKVLVSTLEKQDTVHELMPWYNTLRPAKPITLSGAPSHLGLWVKGNSDWGRFIYTLRDARGERWISIGAKDDYNCDDVHSWSSFNFDGWRYLRFELPRHLGWDNFRKHGTTWWRHEGGDGIVDLPLQLENMIIEQRSHLIYVNDVQPVPGNTVAFGKLFVEYADQQDATSEAVRQSRLRMPIPTDLPDLPNRIRELERDGVGAPTRILKLRQPSHQYDGTRIHVDFEEVAEAKKYFVWVSAHEDGRGAVNMTTAGIAPGGLVTRLRPGVKLYFWVTYQDAAGKMSKPSPAHGEVLKDEFKEK